MKKILITREPEQAAEFAELLKVRGLEPVLFPVLKIIRPHSWNELEEKIIKIDEYDTLIFTSANSVHMLFNPFTKRIPRGKLLLKKFCAVGEKTRIAIEKLGFTVDITPENYTAKALAEAIFKSEIPIKKALFLHGNLSKKQIEAELLKGGVLVDSVEVYKTVPLILEKDDVIKTQEMLSNGEISVVTFFSPSSVENFLKIIQQEFLKSVAIAAVGTTTESMLLQYGLKADILPKDGKFTADKLAEEIAEFLKHNPTYGFPPARE
ncbi:MAG: uroporphyrinogen-III synthase [Bacteroidota bacterium]